MFWCQASGLTRFEPMLSTVVTVAVDAPAKAGLAFQVRLWMNTETR